MKKKPIYFTIAIFLIAILVIYINLAHHSIKVINVVTRQPIEDVELAFNFSQVCHSEDVYRGNYDYETCEGRYKRIENQVTDKNGKVSFWTFPFVLHPAYFRYTIKRSDGYAKTPSHDPFFHPVVWLVPNNAPLPSSKAAAEYLSKQPEIRKIINFYTSKGMRAKLDYHEKWSYYGVYSIGIDVSKPLIRSGQNPKIAEDKWSIHRSSTILVHPGNYDYVICNPWSNEISHKIELLGVEEGEESQLFENLENTHFVEIGTDGCNPDLLLKKRFR